MLESNNYYQSIAVIYNVFMKTTTQKAGKKRKKDKKS